MSPIPDCLSKEQHQPRTLRCLTRRGIRASAAVSGARLTLLRLRPRRHNRRCRRASLAPTAEAADPPAAGLRVA